MSSDPPVMNNLSGTQNNVSGTQNVVTGSQTNISGQTVIAAAVAQISAGANTVVGTQNVVTGTQNIVAGNQYNITMTLKNGQVVARVFMAPAQPQYALVGRDDLLNQLRPQLLVGGAAVAMYGEAGVGKSALGVALAWDDALLQRFAGVLWATIGPDRRLDDVLDGLLIALVGADVLAAATTLEAKVALIQANLQMQPYLLVFDDVWDKQQATQLRNITAPNCAQLLTTRDQTIAQEFAAQTTEVNELTTAQGVELLTMLCPSVKGQEATLSRLADAVGGLPLALNLIGGYLREHITFARQAQTAIAAVDQAQEWLALADSKSRLSIAQVIGRSLDNLADDASRTAFYALSVFAPKPATFSLDAAIAVSNANEETVATFVRRNLLDMDSSERLSISRSIIAVAQSRATDLFAAHVAHASFYYQLLKQDPNAWQTLAPEYPQIQLAWGWFSTTPATGDFNPADFIFPYINYAQTFQQLQGYWRDGLTWAQVGLKLAQQSGGKENEGALLDLLGKLYTLLGDQQQSLTNLQQALAIRRQLGNQVDIANTLNNIGTVYNTLGDKDKALASYAQAIPIMQQQGDKVNQALALANMARLYSDTGKVQQALDSYQQSISLGKELGDAAVQALALNGLGAVYARQSNWRNALSYYEQATPLFEQIGDRASAAQVLSNIGECYTALGDNEKALSNYQQALATQQQIGNLYGVGLALNNLGQLIVDNDPAQGISYFQQALTTLQQAGDASSATTVLSNLGLALAEQGDTTTAITMLQQAVTTSQQIGDVSASAYALNNIGSVYSQQQDYNSALTAFQQALPLMKQVGDTVGEAQVLINIGWSYLYRGDKKQARSNFKQAIAIAQPLQNSDQIAQAQAGLAKLDEPPATANTTRTRSSRK